MQDIRFALSQEFSPFWEVMIRVLWPLSEGKGEVLKMSSLCCSDSEDCDRAARTLELIKKDKSEHRLQ